MLPNRSFLHHFLTILFLFSKSIAISVKENFTYKSLLTGKYYRLIPSGASYEDYQRQVSLDCVIPNIHCLPEESNVIDVFFGVKSAGDCQLSCVYHNSECAVFTWFDEYHSTFPNSCFLYSRCEKAIQSEHSVTGPPSCVCGRKVACQGVKNNFVGFKENIEEEKLCQKECVASDQCQFYTWFDKTNTVFRNYCLLFTSCDKVTCNCHGCSSGPPSCAPSIGEILPSAAPEPAVITAENLSVSSSLEPPVSDENDLSDANHLSDANDVNDDDEDDYEGSPSNNQLLIDSSHKEVPSIQITEGSDNIFLNISNFSDSQEQDIASAAGLNNLVGNNTEGFKATVLNYFPSLKWLFVFVE